MTDDHTSQATSEREPHHSCRSLVIVFVVLTFYALSPIPIAWGLMRLGLYDHVQTAYETFYAPLAYLVKHIEFLDSFYEWQVRRFFS